LWSRWIRDTLTVLTGLGIETHEALFRPAAPLMVAAGLVLVGKAPADALVGRWLSAAAASPPATCGPPGRRPRARSSS
jgi:hypothetical protein